MKILKVQTNEIMDVKDKDKIKRMLRYPDLFQEVKETPKKEIKLEDYSKNKK